MTPTLIAPPEQLAIAFRELAGRWRAETLYLSSTTDIATHPAYQRIIGFGPQVIPLILAELSARPGHWFWALAALTGEDPVPRRPRRPPRDGRILAPMGPGERVAPVTRFHPFGIGRFSGLLAPRAEGAPALRWPVPNGRKFRSRSEQATKERTPAK